MIRDIAFILAGYAAGSILFAKVFCLLLKKTDVAKNTKDNNPGTSNAFKNGGILCGALTLICDVTKGFLPVFFYTRKEVTFLLALVIAAPVIGHVFSAEKGSQRHSVVFSDCFPISSPSRYSRGRLFFSLLF